jgi:hypothetical protein
VIAILVALLAAFAVPGDRMAVKDYGELHAAQWEAWNAPERHQYILGGRGSGKDHYAVGRTLDEIGKAGPGWDAFYIGPSYRQVKKIAWKRFIDAIPKRMLAGKPNKSELLFTFKHGPTLQLVGSDNTDSLRGPDINLAVITEFAFCKEDILEAVEGGLRSQRDRMFLITSPDGPGHALEHWEAIAGDDEWARFHWPTWINPLHDAKGLEKKRLRLAKNVYAQEYDAEFIVQRGAIYGEFSLLRNVRPVTLDPQRPVVIGQDYNAGYIGAVIGQVNRVEVAPGRWDTGLCIAADFVSTGTIEHHAVNLQLWLKQRGINHQTGVELWADASGDFQAVGNREAKRDSSDNRVMMKYGFKVKHPPQNPKVMERIHALQSVVCSGVGERRFFVDPSCRELINCLQRQTFNEWGKPDKAHGLDHPNDAAGYVAVAKFPVHPPGFARSA